MIYIISIFVLVLVDQITKYIIDTRLIEGESIPIIGDFFHLTFVKNRGIAFGMFQGKLDIIGIATIVAIVAIAAYFYKERKKLSIFDKIGYTFILSGAIGNMIDRCFKGYVVDMIDVRGIWHYVFNVADVWINIGVIIIIVDQLFLQKKKKNEEDK